MQPDKIKNALPEYYRRDGRYRPPHITPAPDKQQRNLLKRELSAEKTSEKRANEHHDTTSEKPYKSPCINTISLQDDYQSDFQVT